jgi:hypothetical protein
MCTKIRTLIYLSVGIEKTTESRIKNLKVPPPEKYEGEDDADIFINFLKAVLRYMSLMRLCGHDYDEERILVLGTLLKGRAELWYNTMIDDKSLEFDLLVIALFKRFVHSATAGSAYLRYEAVEYKPSEGIQAFFDSLMDAADRMIQRPSEIEISRKFVFKLPQELVKFIHTYKGYTVKRTKLSTILTTALLWEGANAEYREYMKQQRQANGTASSSKTDGQVTQGSSD